jgi:hypothetical protein
MYCLGFVEIGQLVFAQPLRLTAKYFFIPSQFDKTGA